MRRKWMVVAMALILALAIPGATVPGAQAVADYDSVDADVPGNATGFSYQNNLIELANGTFATVYTDHVADNTTNITLKYSTDGGDTWSTAVWVDKNSTGNESEPCVAVNITNGTIHIVYTTYNDTNASRVFYNRVWVSNWTADTPVVIADPTDNSSQPYIAVSTADTDIRLWTFYRQQVTGDWRIFGTDSINDGGSWTEGANVFTDADINQSWPCLATDMNGTVHMTYSEENGTDDRWDLYYTRLVSPYAAWSTELQVDWETTLNQVEGKIVVAGPVTIGSTSIEGKIFFWTEQTNDTTTQEVHWVFGDTGRDGTPNQSMVITDNGYRVTGSGNLTGIRAAWTDTTDDHIHYSYINVDWEAIFALDPADYDTWAEVLAALSDLVNYATDTEITIDLSYVTYNDTWASLMWYYDGGDNTIDKMVFTHSNNTYVVFYDFDDDWSVDPYAWITNLTNLIIAVMGVFLVVIILGGLMKSFGKITK